MEKSETYKSRSNTGTLSSDPIYFKYIFKKTEKIVCAVFYTLHNNKDINSDDEIIKDVERSAQRLLAVSLEVLESSKLTTESALRKVGHRLIELESKLRILNAVRLLSSELLSVFQNEIESLFRSLNAYKPEDSTNPLFVVEAETAALPKKHKQARALADGQQYTDKTLTLSDVPDRRTRVLNLLKEKGHASIKDISDSITDCSEKTIQRELISLIKDNLVVREGERRWSVYKLA